MLLLSPSFIANRSSSIIAPQEGGLSIQIYCLVKSTHDTSLEVGDLRNKDTITVDIGLASITNAASLQPGALIEILAIWHGKQVKAINIKYLPDTAFFDADILDKLEERSKHMIAANRSLHVSKT